MPDSHLKTPPPIRYEAVDGEGEPTIWELPLGKLPQPIVRRSDLPYRARHLWPRIVQAVCG